MHREERKQRCKLKTVSVLGEVTRVNNSEVIVKDRDRNTPDQNKILKPEILPMRISKHINKKYPNKNLNLEDK